MKSKMLCVALVSLVGVSAASAHGTHWAWTEPRAEKVVLRDAAIRLPQLSRKSLEKELSNSIALFRNLENLAWEARDDQAAARFHNLRYRFSTALGKVQGGLRVDTVECTGSSAALPNGRFKHFRCPSSSEALKIPSVEVAWEERANLPTVVEGPARTVGPVQAQLDVHVTGKSAIAYRQRD